MPSAAYDAFENEVHGSHIPGFMIHPAFFLPWMGIEIWGHTLLGKGVLSAAEKFAHNRPLPTGGGTVRRLTGFGNLTRATGAYRGGEWDRRKLHHYLRSSKAQWKGYVDYRVARGNPAPKRAKGYIAQQRQLVAANREMYGPRAAGRMQVGRNILGLGRTMGLWFAVDLAVTAAEMVYMGAMAYEPKRKEWGRRKLETGGGFIDTRMAQTQRARALQGIHNTQLSTRAVLGNEAAMMHYG